MRLTRPINLRLTEVTPYMLIFTAEGGERFQITVLDHDLIRVQFFPDGKARVERTWTIVDKTGDTPREGRRRDDLSPFPLPTFTHNVEGDKVYLRTEQLLIEITQGTQFGLRWMTADGQEFARDAQRRAYPYDHDGAVYHYLIRREGEHYYGFGEKAGPLDKANLRMRMFNLDAMGYNAEHGDPLYKHIPFYITLVPEQDRAYGLFYDTFATCTFDMGKETDNYYETYRYFQAEMGDLDYYLIYGGNISEVVSRYMALIGRPALPPRWSLGYLASTMAYTEAENAQERLAEFVHLCQLHDIPCDLFHLSSGYTLGEDGKRYVFTWNRKRVPDPAQMVQTFHNAGIKVAANIKPFLLTTHPMYEEAAAQGLFIRQAQQDAPHLELLWGGEGAYLDFTNPAAYDWWKQQIKEQLLAYGIDAIWNDNNEFEIWDDAARCFGFGEEMPIGLARPLQTLLMARASYEALLEYYPDQRPFVISRAGCPGVQRYAQTWSGDNTSSWHTLKWNIPMGLSLSLSGMPNTGHDVGGFIGETIPEPELFVRWVQQGVFFPRFCIHSWHKDRSINEPWMHPDVLPIVREWIKFRYQLIPYLYSLLENMHQQGTPIMRPLCYQFPDDPQCDTESFNFMLGEYLLVASILGAGATACEVYLPAGTRWYDFYTRQEYEGGQIIEVAAPLDKLPLFVREGGWEKIAHN